MRQELINEFEKLEAEIEKVIVELKSDPDLNQQKLTILVLVHNNLAISKALLLLEENK